jgi:hypothetical protein
MNTELMVQAPEGRWIDISVARALMDDALCERIHGTVDTEQEFFDAYLTAHMEKYSRPFVMD